MKRSNNLIGSKNANGDLHRVFGNAAASSSVGRDETQGNSCSTPGNFNVEEFSRHRSIRAYELLASQPLSVAGIEQEQRALIVISAVIDDHGREHVVSRFGDEIWDLQCMFDVRHHAVHEMKIQWPIDIPYALVEDTKAAVYAWFKRGKNGRLPPRESTLLRPRYFTPTLRYLASRGIRRFDQIQAIHVSDLREELRKSVLLGTMLMHFEVLELVSTFSKDVQYPLRVDLWGGESFGRFCDRSYDLSEGRTPVIPPAVQEALFNQALSVLKTAPAVLDARDAGKYDPLAYSMVSIRDSVLYLLQISTGMRVSESMGLSNNCWRSETINGVDYFWIKTTEFKTKKGEVEFLAPPQLIEALELLQRWAKPYQEQLRSEMMQLEKLLEVSLSVGSKGGESHNLLNGKTKSAVVQRLATVRASINKLFLGLHKRESGSEAVRRVGVMSNKHCNDALRRVAVKAGIDRKPANHQCRRTFAWIVANSKIGKFSLIFLKWHFKHSSISMTQLYAANPKQDQSLYKEIFEEIISIKTSLMDEYWFKDDAPLAGGAGRKIKESRDDALRAIAIKNRRELLAHTAAHLTIRSNGHAWCLAERRGCGGEGIYDAGRCADCSGAIIDANHITVWQKLHLMNLELLNVDDCGEGERQRALREIDVSASILHELGAHVPQASDDMDSYQEG